MLYAASASLPLKVRPCLPTETTTFSPSLILPDKIISASGSRPLKRVIQKSVQEPLAEMILSGSIKDGEKVVVSVGKQGLTFNGKLAEAA